MSSAGAVASVLVSMFIETFLYGCFTSLFIISTAVLVKKGAKMDGKINFKLLSVSVAMFLLATMHAAVNLTRALEAFVFSGEPPAQYLLTAIPSPLFILKNAIYVLQTLIGDGFLIYRLYLVWSGCNFALSILVTCFISSIGVGVGLLQSQATAGPGAVIFASPLAHWLISFFALTLFTDLTCTALIAYRVWTIHKRIHRELPDRPSLIPAISIIIESGAVYSLCVAILLGLYVSDSYYHKIMLDVITQLIGVVFSVIIIRVSLGISAENRRKVRLDTLFISTPPNEPRHSSNTGQITFQQIQPPSVRRSVKNLKSERRIYPPTSFNNIEDHHTISTIAT